MRTYADHVERLRLRLVLAVLAVCAAPVIVLELVAFAGLWLLSYGWALAQLRRQGESLRDGFRWHRRWLVENWSRFKFCTQYKAAVLFPALCPCPCANCNRESAEGRFVLVRCLEPFVDGADVDREELH